MSAANRLAVPCFYVALLLAGSALIGNYIFFPGSDDPTRPMLQMAPLPTLILWAGGAAYVAGCLTWIAVHLAEAVRDRI